MLIESANVAMVLVALVSAAMGEPVIPLILGRLQKVPESWFWALKHLAGEDVAKDTDNPVDAAKAWLKWGRKKGHIA